MALSALAISALFFLSAGVTLAAENKKTEPTECNFGDKIQSLELIQNNAKLGESEKIKAELQIRKQILRQIISCSSEEARLLKLKLTDTSIVDRLVEKLKLNLITEINQAVDYYQNKNSQIDNLGIWGSKNMAQQILDWRRGNYAQLIERTANLVAWNNNQGMIGVAEIRLAETKKDLEVEIDNQKIQEVMDEAETNLTKAKTLNQRAREALLNSNNNSINYLEIIKQSLESLGKMYDNFFEIKELATDT